MLRFVSYSSKHLSHRFFNTSTYAQTVRQLDTSNITTLKNGLRIATQPNSGLNCSIGLFLDVGPVNETASNNGITNFIANVAFRGTLQRNREQLKKEVEGMGAILDSFISREISGYVINCCSEDSNKALEILADVTINPKFEEADVVKTRNDILQNLEELEYNYETVVMDYLHATAYQGTPLGQSPYGPTNNIRSFDRHSLRDFAKTHFKPTRMVLVFSGGNFKEEELIKNSERLFGGLDSTYEHSTPNFTENYRYTGSDMKLRDDDMEYAHVALAVQGSSYVSIDSKIALDVANALIGQWSNAQSGGGVDLASPLLRKMRENNLGEFIRPFNLCYKTTGLWGTYIVAPRQTAYDLVQAVQQEWMRQATNISLFEIERARASLRSQILREWTDPMRHCGDIARDVLYCGRMIPMHDLDSRIEAVTPQTVRDTVHRYVYDQCPVLAAVGPTETLANYNNLRTQMYWLRM